MSTRRDQTAHEYAVLCRNLFAISGISADAVQAAVICSVVPPLNDSFVHLAKEFFRVNPLFVEADQQNLMKVLYRPPSDVGADRIVNAIAARELFGAPLVVVDFGTATTFDVISSQGEYVGGLIAPGIGISAEALFVRAAKLPRIEIKRPEAAFDVRFATTSNDLVVLLKRVLHIEILRSVPEAPQGTFAHCQGQASRDCH